MNKRQLLGYDEPCFVISVAAKILGLRTQTLRYYERIGLIEPFRSQGNQRVFSRRDIDRVKKLRTLVDDIGVNLAGVEVIMGLLDRLQQLEDENDFLKNQIKK
ncbi:MAG: MerR family transcriptional regulator [Dehalococcoidia bacterium]|nr:MerR family DNA-binding transcriptional regulator [Chloroflexota bacterium]MCH2305834.1 MerR family transcriptional regulator [SAR202 cluster bacterium]|tara:strand:+ start:662 stop:970 length:309 start_codon:yes stop_codon:yes gene_type:complete